MFCGYLGKPAYPRRDHAFWTEEHGRDEQYAKRQQTWFRHQLGGSVVTLDATRSPEKLAAEIAGLWEKRS